MLTVTAFGGVKTAPGPEGVGAPGCYRFRDFLLDFPYVDDGER